MSSEIPLDPTTIYFICMICPMINRSYDVAAAHVTAKHGDQRPERCLDVAQMFREPARSAHIANSRAEHARTVFNSALRSRDTFSKRRIAHSPDQTPTRGPKVSRLAAANTIAKNSAITGPYPSFLLRARGAHIPFTPPQGVDSFDGLLASIAAVYDEAVPGADEFDWVAAAEANWEVVIGRVGGGRTKRIVISSDEDVMMCLMNEPMEIAGSRVRVMMIGDVE